MWQPPNDPLFLGFAAALDLASLGAWVYLAYRWRRDGMLLASEPRRPVPWGAAGALLACAFPIVALLSTAPEAASEEHPVDLQPLQVCQQLAASMAGMAALVGTFVFVIGTVSGANARDLGLPTSFRELRRDFAVGIVACLAALAPVYGVLILLAQFAGEPHHPLVEMVGREANPLVLLTATVSAVIVAPICEEISFRLLLQGWLEKGAPRQMANDECLMTNEDSSSDDQPSFDIRHSSLPMWLPIIISSLLFALAHFGQGVAPVALFILAIVLGYTYQRTHRIVPCIVTHALFNLLTMIALWWSALSPAS
jgi:membrane protease YdiL (CAAX protease family)